jgi:hypothetical protein
MPRCAEPRRLSCAADLGGPRGHLNCTGPECRRGPSQHQQRFECHASVHEVADSEPPSLSTAESRSRHAHATGQPEHTGSSLQPQVQPEEPQSQAEPGSMGVTAPIIVSVDPARSSACAPGRGPHAAPQAEPGRLATRTRRGRAKCTGSLRSAAAVRTTAV